MNIVYGANDNYAKYLGISMFSLLYNNTSAKTLDIYVLANGIQPSGISALSAIAGQFKRSIHIIDITGFSHKFDFSIHSYGFDITTLSRLFLGSLLPSSVEKVLYLDCDTIVNGSLLELEEMDLTGFYAAAVPELYMPADKKALIGHSRKETYYNAGVLWINLSLWRSHSLENKFISYYKKMRGRLLYNDQDIINHCCKHRLLTLSQTYNLSTNLCHFPKYFVKKLQPAYDCAPENYREYLENPRIIHYLGDERPWIRGNRNAYRGHFIFYRNKTVWRSVPLQPGQEWYMLCYHILNRITRISPQFRMLFSKLIGINKYKWFGKK